MELVIITYLLIIDNIILAILLIWEIIKAGDKKMAKNNSIHATKLTLPHVLVLLGDELFIHYINFIYPSYDLYEYVTIDGIARVHRYFLERRPKPEPKPEKFDRLLTPMWTLQEIREQIKGD